MCVTVGAVCDFTESHNVDVTISKPGYTASANTGETSGVCFEDIPPGHYSVSATKEGCSSLSKSVDIACGDDTEVFAGAINCSEGAFFEFTVGGCNGSPLPGATCTISGANSGSAVTDGDGNCAIPISHTGTTAWTITPPNGRLQSASGSLSVPSLCEATGVARNLAASDGYTCCGALGDTPFPVTSTLILTDDNGSFEVAACDDQTCVIRNLSDVSPTGNAKTCTCIGGSASLPPDDIGNNDTGIAWRLQLGMATDPINYVGYFFAVKSQIGPSLLYRADACDPGSPCSPADSRRQWRLVTDCSNVFEADPNEPHAPSSYTINSVFPLNITFHFASGNGYGPGDASAVFSGDTYTGTVVLSEP